ncbi:protein of unknown function DUF1972 [Cellulophaga algicola DSM 14237]|uniref:DUF1972 domain-containing protein n=1 Tax=Cellulophaga algicola (strain DSM 14237 / IC166 / ACAM 630) TaxID=688270 RepID=E6XB27_CELAD|nr:DUF1972 domain-containing protein [Cellulophaga algicola]ADV48883.1 protein of unknown function DUF1972 [Cellulophaga algicola DSM 14237]
MSSKERVAIIGTVGIPAKYGGFETLANYLVDELHTRFNFTVYCSKYNYDNKVKSYNNAKLIYLPLNANGKSSIVYDAISILHSLFYSDTLLILGVSGAFMIPFVRIFSNKKIITNIDGLEWKRNKWGRLAKKYLKWQESIAVKYSHNVIVDNQGIREHVKLNYNKKSTLITYGSNHAFFEILMPETIIKYELPKEYAFKVCRIEPENNIELILATFSKCNKNIVIIGNWNSSRYGEKLKLKYSPFDNIWILDPIYDQKILNQIRSNCTIYIHGHSAGGTNPSLVEAMYLGLPIIAFNVNYNKFTMNNLSYYFSNEDDLLKILNKLEKEKLKLIGIDLKTFAESNYTWSKIANEYSKLF